MIPPILILASDQEINITRVLGPAAVRSHEFDFDFWIYGQGFPLDQVVYLFTSFPGYTLFEAFVEY